MKLDIDLLLDILLIGVLVFFFGNWFYFAFMGLPFGHFVFRLVLSIPAYCGLRIVRVRV